MNKIELRFLVCFLIVVMAISLCSCAAHVNETIPPQNSPSGTGGYEIKTDTMYLKTVVDGQYKYSHFQSINGNRTIEYYAGPTEMIVIDTQGDVTKYAKQTYADIGQIYTNPTYHMFQELEELDFTRIEDEDGYAVYKAERTVAVQDAEQIKYNKYTIDLDWRDGKHYRFSYYDYADGSTLISAEAPDEINPRINQNTEWVVDMDSLCVYNEKLNESFSFIVTDTTSGQGVSPDGTQTSSTQSTYYTYKYVDQKTNKVDWLMYQKDNPDTQNGTKIHILYSADIKKPDISAEAIEMSNEEIQSTLMLISMLGSLF